ncbi:MAG: hypothetical protein CL863_04390 [Cyanobium sp. RS427]|nr:hypothetical protein [Cyanobium sp. RS427]
MKIDNYDDEGSRERLGSELLIRIHLVRCHLFLKLIRLTGISEAFRDKPCDCMLIGVRYD